MFHRANSKMNTLKQLPSLQQVFLAWTAAKLHSGDLARVLDESECENTAAFISNLEPVLARLNVPAPTAKQYRLSLHEEIVAVANDEAMQDVRTRSLHVLYLSKRHGAYHRRHYIEI